jgi:hypothetical protein
MSNKSEKNLEYHKKYTKEYYQKNKENIKEKVKERVMCECGMEYPKNNKVNHEKTKKHKNIILQKNLGKLETMENINNVINMVYELKNKIDEIIKSIEKK